MGKQLTIFFVYLFCFSCIDLNEKLCSVLAGVRVGWGVGDGEGGVKVVESL